MNPVERISNKEDLANRPCKHGGRGKVSSEQRETSYRLALPHPCIAFTSEKGKQLFKDALSTRYMNCYFPLASQFRTQDDPRYCGISSLVMILNALDIDPGVPWRGAFRYFHEDMLNWFTPLKEVKIKGISMDTMLHLAKCNQLRGELTRVTDDFGIARLREEIKFATSKEDRFIVVSYARRGLGQTGHGHFSPIGGYNVTEDMVLILDVARYKYPPAWVPLSEIWKAMRTLDAETGLHRGYLILWRAQDKNVLSQPA